MAFVYILFSTSLNKFYTGSTELTPEERLEMHLQKLYGTSKFTSVANDWKVFYTLECSSIKQARSIEQHIKRMKTKTYIQNLSKYPEIVQKLLNRY